MKKLMMLTITVVMLISCVVSASAESIDLSGLSFDELIALKDQINLAIWNSAEWQEVTVPAGVWEVGKDIPAGTWTVKCGTLRVANGYIRLDWGNTLSEDGRSVPYDPTKKSYGEQAVLIWAEDQGVGGTEYTLTVKDGDYIVIDPMFGDAVFTPYIGKPSLGFK